MDNENEIMRAIGRIEGQLASLIAMQSAHSRTVTGLERRVSHVESRVTRAYGVCAGLAIAGSLVGYVLRAVLGGH